jgi:hypothetical protein
LKLLTDKEYEEKLKIHKEEYLRKVNSTLKIRDLSSNVKKDKNL